MTEIWTPIPGHLGSYEISNYGRVRSLDRIVNRGHSSYPLKGRILKQSKSGPPGKKYLAISLGRASYKKVHRLVLEAFVGPCPTGMEACHNNGDRFDNRLENLRWDTRSNNNLDKAAHGTDHNANKTHCPRGHKYTDENTIQRPDGGRRCRACHRDKSRRAMREKLSTPEGRADVASYQKGWRRRTGKVTGLHNYGSRTHCANGHEFTPENTITRSDGGRRCRTCQTTRRPEANRRALEQRRADPAKRGAWNAYMREYRKRTRRSN